MDESILNSIKELVNSGEEDSDFDNMIIAYINSAFLSLNALAVGSDEIFHIEDASTTWGEFTDNPGLIGSIKKYIAAKVRLGFDPPTTSYMIDLMKDQALESGFYLNVYEEPE